MAFYNCISIKELVIPEGVVSIGNQAFYNMSGLTKIVLPSTLTFLGKELIRGDSKLLSVISHITNPFEIDEMTFYIETSWSSELHKSILMPPSSRLYIPKDTRSKYEALSGWASFTDIVEGSPKEAMVDGLKYFYFDDVSTSIVVRDDSYTEMSTVTVPATITINDQIYNVTGLANSAFFNCTRLKTLTLLEGLETIGNMALQNTGINNITLPNTLKTIGERAFLSSRSLKTLVIPEGVVSIGRNAFGGMSSLKSLELPSTLNNIGTELIIGNGNLVSLVSHIDEPFAVTDDVFVSLKSWNSVTQQYDLTPSKAMLYVPKDSKSKYEALSGWTFFAGIEEGEPKEIIIDGIKYFYVTEGVNATVLQNTYKIQMTIPSTITVDEKTYHVTAIDNSAFKECYGLKTMILSEGLETIGEMAFCSTSLTEIVLPSTIKTIGKDAFKNCRLSSVTIKKETPLSLEDDVFYNRADAVLYVPKGCRSIYQTADYWKDFKEILVIGMTAFTPTDISTLPNVIYANPAIGQKGGEVTIEICLKNEELPIDYNFELKLPDGFYIAKDEANNYLYELSNRHINKDIKRVSFNEETGVYSFRAKTTVQGDDGVIWKLKLIVPEDAEEGDYPIIIQNAKYYTYGNYSYGVIQKVMSTLTIINYKKGDVNGDGDVDIADAVCIVNHVVGKETPIFIEAAADVNGDGDADIADAVRIVNLVVTCLGTTTRLEKYVGT